MSEEIQDISKELKSLLTEHSYYKRYEEQSIVTHTIGDSINFYKATKNVPRYVSINNKRYWKKLNKKTDAGESSEPTSDNDFISIYFPPESGEPTPAYYVQPYDNLFIIGIMAYYIVPNQTIQPEITGVKINDVSYSVVSSEYDGELVPGITTVDSADFMLIDEEMYVELQYMTQIGVDIDANIGDGLFMIYLDVLSDTAPSGPITFELNTDVGNCTTIVPQYV